VAESARIVFIIRADDEGLDLIAGDIKDLVESHYAVNVAYTTTADLREFGTIGDEPVVGPVRFQGGVIFLHGYGCTHCGNGFWTEHDDKRRLSPGALHPCPHCAAESVVPDGVRSTRTSTEGG
jgi:hypothetical protein